MSTIFISYAREDRPKAKQLAEALEQKGWTVWWDIVIPAGKKFGDVILEKLNTADAILVLWSESSIKSDWVLDEAQVAKKRNVLIPVFIERVNPPLGYGQIHAADLVGWNGSANAQNFFRLVQDIAEMIRTSPDIDVVDTSENAYSIGLKFYGLGKYIEAYPLLLIEARKGEANAQFYLGKMYDLGWGVTQNYEDAVKWYRLSAKQGNTYAQANLKLLGEIW